MTGNFNISISVNCYPVLQIITDKLDNKISFLIVWLPYNDTYFPLKITKKKLKLPIVFERHVFEIGGYQEFLLLPIKILWMELISCKKSVWLVLGSCPMLWSWLTSWKRPPFGSLLTGERWTSSNTAGFSLDGEQKQFWTFPHREYMYFNKFREL